MSTDARPPKRLFFYQFTVAAMLLLMTGVCSYLGGRIHGYHDGIAMWDSLPRVVITYSVPSTPPPAALEKRKKALESLALRIKSDVMPGTWEEAGGKSRLVLDTANERLVVSANQFVHEEIASYLSELRTHWTIAQH